VCRVKSKRWRDAALAVKATCVNIAEQGCRHGRSEQWGGLTGPVLSQEAEEGARFFTPPAANFNAKHDEATTASVGKFGVVHPFFVATSIPQRSPSISAVAGSGLATLC